MIDTLRFVFSALCTLGGLFVLISGVLGLYRFRYSMSRLHAAALFDTMGILLMLLGVMVGYGFSVATLKMLVVIAFLWLTSPVASHLIARLEVTINDDLSHDMTVKDEEMVRHEKEGD